MQEIERFVSFLGQANYGRNSIRIYSKKLAVFLDYLASQDLKPEVVTYADCVALAEELKAQNWNPRSINLLFTVVRHYYRMLDIDYDPAYGLIVRGSIERVPEIVLSRTELNELYEKHPSYDDRTSRNKVITGLLVYQGLTNQDLHQLQCQDIQLQQGYVRIRTSKARRSGTLGRELVLQPNQVLDLQSYLDGLRPKLLKDIASGRIYDLFRLADRSLEDLPAFYIFQQPLPVSAPMSNQTNQTTRPHRGPPHS